MQTKTDSNSSNVILTKDLWSALFQSADQFQDDFRLIRIANSIDPRPLVITKSQGDFQSIARLSDRAESVIAEAMYREPGALQAALKSTIKDIIAGEYPFAVKALARISQFAEALNKSRAEDPIVAARTLNGLLSAASSDYLSAAASINLLKAMGQTKARDVLIGQVSTTATIADLRLPSIEKAA